ncbi:MAG: adenylyltransferase/cytidyltransferase family protein [Phycisphaerae bacterium]
MTQPLHRKILDRDSLAQSLRELRASGKTVVQCHGCFDIVHPGHVRYLQFARQLGDVLVVSLTGDAAITKSPDRPYIPQELRAENLAALEFVDWVVIDPNPTACELLEALRPDVYVKGREYAVVSDPRFVREREIVEQYGGRVVFHSGDVVFSSTRLIQSLEREEHLDECRLRVLCGRNAINLPAARATVESFANIPVIVVGDLIRERYVFCDASEAADDAPVLSLQKLGSATYWGGAAAVALQLQALGAEPFLVTATCEDAASREVKLELAHCAIETQALPLRQRLVRRTTFVADDAKVFKLSDGVCQPLDSAWERRAAAAIRERLPAARLLIWCDHGYGMVTPGLVRAVTRTARGRDTVLTGYALGPRGEVRTLCETDLLCVTERRLREAMHDMGSGLPSVAWNLLSRTRGQTAIVSLHKRGLIGFDGRGEEPVAASRTDEPRRDGPKRLRSEFVPALAAHYVDLLGVDEAVLSVASLTVATGGSLPMATYLAAAAEAVAAARPGRTCVRTAELCAWLDTRLELRTQSGFLPDAATIADIARIAPPLATTQTEPVARAGSSYAVLQTDQGEAKEP